MSIRYKSFARGNPFKPGAPKKFYPAISSRGRRSLRQVAERIAEMSTLSTPDVMAVLEALLQVVPQELLEGNIVELGDFGAFWLRANTKGIEDGEEVRPGQIHTLRARFHPGREFRKVLAGAKFEKS